MWVIADSVHGNESAAPEGKAFEDAFLAIHENYRRLRPAYVSAMRRSADESTVLERSAFEGALLVDSGPTGWFGSARRERATRRTNHPGVNPEVIRARTQKVRVFPDGVHTHTCVLSFVGATHALGAGNVDEPL